MTPLQLAVYTAALATGARPQPHLAGRITDAQGGTVFRAEAGAEALPLAPEHREAIVAGMVRAHAEPGGTGYRFFGDFPLPTAGKTGTAEVAGRTPNGVYVAFAPVDDPAVAVAMVVEGAGSGTALAPVVKAVLAGYFDLSMPPDDPAAHLLGD